MEILLPFSTLDKMHGRSIGRWPADIQYKYDVNGSADTTADVTTDKAGFYRSRQPSLHACDYVSLPGPRTQLNPCVYGIVLGRATVRVASSRYSVHQG